MSVLINKKIVPVAVSLLVTLFSSAALADIEPLSLFQIDSFAQHLGCVAASSSSSTCPDENIRWEKDLLAGIDEKDYELAIREYWDDGEMNYICYRKRNGDTLSNIHIEPSECDDDCAVVPRSLCDPGASECIEARESAEECEDVDGDGIRRWQEDALGSSDYVANEKCDMNSPAGCGFTMKCDDEHVGKTEMPDTAICLPRENCDDEECTAFHLEVASINNNELIVYVIFDYAPVPPTILDLYLDYDFNFMTLVDARLMKSDTCTNETGLCNKELATSHPSDNRLRLTVLSPTSNATIPMGMPIIELVFDRTAHGQTSIAFTKQDHLQIEAMAPEILDEDGNPVVDSDGTPILNQLANDELWGGAVQVPAVDPRGPRLLLYYSFDNAEDYMDYSDVKDGAELCNLIGECSVLDENDDYQREKKEIYQAKLNVLQRGVERISEQVQHGVIGPAGYLNGKTDHLEFPVTVNDPSRDQDGHYYYSSTNQSFSLSTWFYVEGDDLPSADTELGQILFSRNHPEEQTKFGIAIGMTGNEPGLYWFDGVLEDVGGTDTTFVSHEIVPDFPLLKWKHFGMVFYDTVKGVDDDNDGLTDEMDDEYDRVNFYLDGEIVALSGFAPRENFDDDHDGITDETDEAVVDMPLVGPSGEQIFSHDAFKLQCPYPDPAGGLILHEEGKEVGALGNIGSPERLFFASAENNQFGIETMDLYGLDRSEILRDGITSAKETDYNPFLDKIVYSSNKNGSYEIWIADGDGSNPRQITQGFGDTDRGVFARRPKWAPDGTGIVFDSNIYSMEYMDNLRHRVYHLYYIQYDRLKNEVAVPLEDGGTSTVLDYDFITASQTLSFYRITAGTDNHSYGAVWLLGKGKDPVDGTNIKGKIWYNSSSYKHNNREIRMMRIPSTISPGMGENIFGKNNSDEQCLVVASPTDESTNDLNIEYNIMDGYSIKGPFSGVQSQIIFKKEWVTYENKATHEAGTGENFQFEIPQSSFVTETISLDPEDTDTEVDVVRFSVYYHPEKEDYKEDEGCWDINHNTVCDSDEEDRNKDGVCSWMDCVAAEIPELYVEYNTDDVYSLVSHAHIGPDPANDKNNITSAHDPHPLAKDVRVYDQPTASEAYVKIRVDSQVNNRPIYIDEPYAGSGPGMFLTQLTFVVKEGHSHKQEDFILKIRKVNQRIGIADMDNGRRVRIGRFSVAGNSNTSKDTLEFIKDAAFSPDGNRLVLHGIQQARPVVLVQEKGATHNPYGNPEDNNMYNEYHAESKGFRLHLENPDNDYSCGDLLPIEFDKISIAPMNVDGMSWEKIERFYPCNWVGTHKDRDSRLYQNAFRGGMDELRLYSYPRDARGFLSDFERGNAWLEKEGRDDGVEPKNRFCKDHYDCPEYMLCQENPDTVVGGFTCQVQPCAPEDPTDCQCDVAAGEMCGVTGKAGVCTLMPIPSALGEPVTDDTIEEWEWVCAAECVSDSQCFKEECLNGPCRFCSNNACHECRWDTRYISGTRPINEIVGCPDRNSWDCVEGSCVTECYAFENGESIYLCDPAVEYCQQGRCKLFDWDWTDLAPATLSSIGDMVFDTIDTTVAIDQRYAVEVLAYGVEDYLHPPEILVEGWGRDRNGGNAFDSQWFKIGHIQVYNKNMSEAQENPYVVYSPVPVSDIRISLVQPLYENLTAASTGLGQWDSKRCKDSDCRTCTKWSDDPVSNGTPGCAGYKCENWRETDSCTHRSPGSRASVGYTVGIPMRASRKACAERKLANCKYVANDAFANQYLLGGQASVVVLETKVAGSKVLVTSSDNGRMNRFCPYTAVMGRTEKYSIPGYRLPDTTNAYNTSVSYFSQSTPAADGGAVSIPVSKRIVYGFNPDAELSNQATAFYGMKPKEEKHPMVTSEYESEAILNCNFNDGVNAPAGADYQVCPRDLNECFNTLFPTSGRDGVINETNNGCAIERGMRRTPCYEFTGNEVTLDFMTYSSDSKEVWRTLDFDLHRSFGYDEGSLKEEKTK